mgnify:CR=1 FL=1
MREFTEAMERVIPRYMAGKITAAEAARSLVHALAAHGGGFDLIEEPDMPEQVLGKIRALNAALPAAMAAEQERRRGPGDR